MRPVRTCQYLDEDFEPCTNMCEGNSLHCATHNHAIRKAEREAKKTKIVKPVKKITEKRAKQNREYLEIRVHFLEQYPMCQIGGCNNKSTEVHHMKGKANDLLTNPENFLAICSDCHRKITEHSAEAIREGYSILRSI